MHPRAPILQRTEAAGATSECRMQHSRLESTGVGPAASGSAVALSEYRIFNEHDRKQPDQMDEEQGQRFLVDSCEHGSLQPTS